MFKNAIEIFDLFGFKIKIDPSWLLIAALIVWSLSSSYFPETIPGLSTTTYFSLAVVAMLGMFASLILHELSHSLVARRFNLKVGGITLFVFGGVAELEHEPRDPNSEFWIAIAGPLMSFALAGLAFVLSNVTQSFQNFPLLSALLNYLALVNLVIGIFNLVPAFPLDGGRVFRAALWHYKQDLLAATRIASRFGTFFGWFLIVVGLTSVFTGLGVGGLWQIVIGFFILTASSASYNQLLIKTALKGQTTRSVMTKSPLTADVNETLVHVINKSMLQHGKSFIPVVDGKELLGYINIAVAQKIDRQDWAATRVGDVYVSINTDNSIGPETSSRDVLEQMTKTGQRKMLVVENGQLVGVVALSDLLSLLEVRRELGFAEKT